MLKNSFLKYLQYEKRYSPHTINSYRTDLEQFGIFCMDLSGNFDVKAIDHRIIRSWIVSLMENNISARSVNRKITTLKSFFKYLLREGILEQTPLDKVLTPKTKKQLPQFVGEKQMSTLLDHVEFGDDYEGTRNRLLIEMLYSTGMRRAEISALRDKDIDTYNYTIKVLGKRNKERIIPFDRSLANSIKLYKNLRNKEFNSTEYFFATSKGKKLYDKLIYRIVNKYLQMVTTIEKKSPHILRHTFATHMLNNGADLNAIKELLGHANLSATQVYTHNTFEKLKSIYKQAHPRA